MDIKKFRKRIRQAGSLAGLVLILSSCDKKPQLVNPVLADVNGDGKKDVISYKWSDGLWGNDNIWVSLNYDGIFGDAQKAVRINGRPRELRVEDLSGDSIPDIVYSISSDYAFNEKIYMAKGIGNGTFQKPVRVSH